MGSKRHVDKLMSVFDFKICAKLGLSEAISTRIIFIYDGREQQKEILIANNNIKEDIQEKLKSWIFENIDVQDVMHMKSKELDADKSEPKDRISV